MKVFEHTKYKIVLSDIVLEIFHNHKQVLPHSHESGGIILGQIVNNSIFITHASTPNIFDKSSRYRFDRDKNAAQVIVNYEYHNSDHKTIYLGEWHTHPENIPTPSGQDQKMIKEQYLLGKLNEAFILLIIQGLHGLYLAVFDGNTLIQCTEQSYI